MRADAGGQLLEGAAVHGGVFPKDIVIADFKGGGLTDVFEILRFPADRSKWEELVVFPEGGGAFKHNVGVKHAVIAEGHIRTNGAIWPDTDVLSELGLGRNDGGGMNHCRDFRRMTAP